MVLDPMVDAICLAEFQVVQSLIETQATSTLKTMLDAKLSTHLA